MTRAETFTPPIEQHPPGKRNSPAGRIALERLVVFPDNPPKRAIDIWEGFDPAYFAQKPGANYKDFPPPTDLLQEDFDTYISSRPLLTSEGAFELCERIEAGVYAEEKAYALIGAREQHQLSAAELSELCDLIELKYAGDDAMEMMIQANLRLVIKAAGRYAAKPGSMTKMDLFQEGVPKLIHAIRKFDHRKRVKNKAKGKDGEEKFVSFSTYATQWLDQGLPRALAAQALTIRLPEENFRETRKIGVVVDELYQTLGRRATLEELSEASGLPLEKLQKVLAEREIEPVSYDAPSDTDTEELTLLDSLGGRIDVRQVESASVEISNPLREAIERLPAKQQEAIVAVHLEGRDISGAARVLRSSPETVRKRLEEALEELRKSFSS